MSAFPRPDRKFRSLGAAFGLSLVAVAGGACISLTALAQVANQPPVATAGIVNNNDENFNAPGSNAQINWRPNGFGDYVIKPNRGGTGQYLGFDPDTKISYLGLGSQAGATGNLFAFKGGVLTPVTLLPARMFKVKSILSSTYYGQGSGAANASAGTRNPASSQQPPLPSIAPGAKTIAKVQGQWKLSINGLDGKQRTYDLYRPHVMSAELASSGQLVMGVDFNEAKWAEPKYAQLGTGAFILGEPDGKVRLVSALGDNPAAPTKVVDVRVFPEVGQPAMTLTDLRSFLKSQSGIPGGVDLKDVPGLAHQ